MKKFIVPVVLALVACSAHATVMTDLTTTATGLITDGVTAVTAIVVAGFAITGVIWGARKIRTAIRGS